MNSIPLGHRVLALVGLACSLFALGGEILPMCGRCGNAGWIHAAIAAIGTAGYSVLSLLGWRGHARAFFAGVFLAAGVHSALAVWMISTRNPCPVCVTAAIAAIANVIWATFARRCAPHLIERVFLPALVSAGVLAFVVLVADGTAQAERHKRLGAVAANAEMVEQDLTITVFEQDHCQYCIDFRQNHVVRLAREFGDRVHVSYVAARESPWVRQTPTIVVPSGTVFEGLPAYADLRAAVMSKLEALKR